MPGKVVLATGNPGKVREIQRILGDLGVEVVPQSELGVGDADETGASFVANALIKARHASLITGLPAIADDSGLVVDALGGRPGVYSARYSGADATDESNIDKLLRELEGVPGEQRTAAFHCCAVFVSADDATSLVAEGRWTGTILEQRRGTEGFGYDPVFFDPECGRTAAELGPELKNARSHRGKALTALAEMLREHFV
ncbi:MAG: RdgB/HAM1 family non-canonical purine NTP pyrophosphatase [Gammaproteobacteria bacterium]|jgi:XTP/dITP diphosphohydrolase|nr:RdgB/HAM1 family non-canonical purine NTP pyrophosphatase [Gammaproteobacteria bacterium]MDH3847653.1 RdgB/HAM1 family non-canonical purine NTP pyrophosphatase [Gammaproteobacteria bacterium]MDH3862403.1 RdgB/HAM1 family non-canonical purine NTP pyrophosphatase [Gammaproteobacteria bacterium]MDH3905916.1 RdgB/HAM1 family non-canonical purine NTP pyrophosphatase [Gammaproteobacteria bacterium]MDH3907982.1 RdgB/HAM1 family non-canonical purine NTP pyrophosphatase [Gammaproteobacteria bacterium